MNNRNGLYVMAGCAVLFYILAGVLINPFIFWTALPLYISYGLLRLANTSRSRLKFHAFAGFFIISVGFSMFYHLSWFFDWWGTKTSSSTSALIFIWLPVYSVICGFAGQLVGWLIGRLRGCQ